jgi:putative transposase
MNEALRCVFMRLHYPIEVILVCIVWYVVYPLSLRQLEEMLAERGVAVDQSLRRDDTYIKVAGRWEYLYRAVDKSGGTVDFLLRDKRDHAAARAFFKQAIGVHDVPEKIAINRSGSNKAPIASIQANSGLALEMR